MTVETGTALHSHRPEQERFRREAALDETIEQRPNGLVCSPI